jgi:hypothetical protein
LVTVFFGYAVVKELSDREVSEDTEIIL